jgi:hypothetical protein
MTILFTDPCGKIFRKGRYAIGRGDELLPQLTVLQAKKIREPIRSAELN